MPRFNEGDKVYLFRRYGPYSILYSKKYPNNDQVVYKLDLGKDENMFDKPFFNESKLTDDDNEIFIDGDITDIAPVQTS